MLQRFPVESKGRRKKLQEVLIIHYLLSFCFLSFFHVNLLLLLTCIGWLCYNNMLYMFSHQMCHGKCMLTRYYLFCFANIPFLYSLGAKYACRHMIKYIFHVLPHLMCRCALMHLIKQRTLMFCITQYWTSYITWWVPGHSSAVHIFHIWCY